ncbi:hypothetical protein ACLOJK_000611 [Asimina triloba]
MKTEEIKGLKNELILLEFVLANAPVLRTMTVAIKKDWQKQKAIDEWLPITSSRNAKWWYSAFHNVTAMVGAGVLSLPFAMSELGWGPGVAVLILSWIITLYTLWQMVEMHEMVPGKRFDRYHELGQYAFASRACSFAPPGLTNTFNCGGTIQEVEYGDGMKGLGGRFLCYSSVPPKRSRWNGAAVVFEWLGGGKLMLDIFWAGEDGISVVDLDFLMGGPLMHSSIHGTCFRWMDYRCSAGFCVNDG